MMFGGYSLDLYCDVELEDPAHLQFENGYGKAQFTSQLGRDAYHNARRHGWKINRVTSQCICPTCAKAGRKPKE